MQGCAAWVRLVHFEHQGNLGWLWECSLRLGTRNINLLSGLSAYALAQPPQATLIPTAGRRFLKGPVHSCSCSMLGKYPAKGRHRACWRYRTFCPG